MILLENLQILAPLQKLPKNVGYLCKVIIDIGFEKLPKGQSGHTAGEREQNPRLIDGGTTQA